jgi:predicted metalloprotease with PDZ domain
VNDERAIGPEELVAEAAEASAKDTARAIDEAAEINEDPKVAEKLDAAALKAQTTTHRVGWLRSFVDRLRGRSKN